MNSLLDGNLFIEADASDTLGVFFEGILGVIVLFNLRQ
jgi:hypothetical protein